MPARTMRLDLAAEYWVHPAYSQALRKAINVARAHGLAALIFETVEVADGKPTTAVAIEAELRGLLADHENRREWVGFQLTPLS